jgi:hypothetical protein
MVLENVMLEAAHELNMQQEGSKNMPDWEIAKRQIRNSNHCIRVMWFANLDHIGGMPA